MIGIGLGLTTVKIAQVPYAKKVAKAYEARVLADGGTVESLQCFTNFAISWGASPITPVALSATTITSDSFVANWEAVAGASYYLLDVSLDSSFSSFVLQNQVVNTTSYTVTGLSLGTTYYYRVRVDA